MNELIEAIEQSESALIGLYTVLVGIEEFSLNESRKMKKLIQPMKAILDQIEEPPKPERAPKPSSCLIVRGPDGYPY